MRLTSPLVGLRKIRAIRGMVFGLGLAAFLNLLQWAFIYLRVPPRPDPIPLHYTITFGIDRIGPWYAAYLLPLSGAMILVLNVLLTLMVIEHQRVAAAFVVILSVLIQLILLAAAFLAFRTL